MEDQTGMQPAAPQAAPAVPVVKQVKELLSQDKIKEKFGEVLGQKAPQFMASITNTVSGSAQLKNSDPISFIEERATEMEEFTGRRPNRMALGVNVYNALKKHPAILERVKYSGSTANPAMVNANVLSQLFEMERLSVQRSIMNNAALGEEAKMQYIGDPNAFLLAYATDSPAVDEPSAGYIFTWDMLGNGNVLPIRQFEGEQGTHSEFIEGLMATDMKKTGDDLAMFFKDAV